MKTFFPGQPRALVLWPKSRSSSIAPFFTHPGVHEQADGFTYLRQSGFGFATLDPCAFPLNPLARKGSTLAGLDIARTIRVLGSIRHFDVLVSMDTPSCLFFLMLKRMLRLPTPVVIIDPAMDVNSRVRRVIHDCVLPQASAIIVFGRSQIRYLTSRYGNVPASFVPHRIDSEFFRASAVTEQRIVAEPYILSVGDDAGRDFDTLFRAAEGLDTRVLLRTNRQISPRPPANVTLLQHRMTFEELRALYYHAEFVVVPLRNTTHASGINTLLEAMSMSKAVVVSGSDGVADYVENERTAIVVPPQDVNGLRSAMTNLLTDARRRAALGVNARRFCEETCAMPAYMKAVAEILKNTIRRGPNEH